jgi:hypothetical protein
LGQLKQRLLDVLTSSQSSKNGVQPTASAVFTEQPLGGAALVLGSLYLRTIHILQPLQENIRVAGASQQVAHALRHTLQQILGHLRENRCGRLR